MRLGWVPALIGAWLASAANAEPARPVVVELFTSQGCSSCPPADAFLTELAQSRADLLPLAFHVTYWDRLGWRDPFALPAATLRQRAYAGRHGKGSVFTPEMVVDGSESVVGSDRAAAEAAFRRAIAHRAGGIAVHVARERPQIVVEIGKGTGGASVLLVGFDAQHRTAIGRGENGGRTLLESNVVRSITPLGRWSGAATAMRVPLPQGEAFAAILQADDGRVLGATRMGR